MCTALTSLIAAAVCILYASVWLAAFWEGTTTIRVHSIDAGAPTYLDLYATPDRATLQAIGPELGCSSAVQHARLARLPAERLARAKEAAQALGRDHSDVKLLMLEALGLLTAGGPPACGCGCHECHKQ